MFNHSNHQPSLRLRHEAGRESVKGVLKSCQREEMEEEGDSTRFQKKKNTAFFLKQDGKSRKINCIYQMSMINLFCCRL